VQARPSGQVQRQRVGVQALEGREAFERHTIVPGGICPSPAP
jgi:hypothetical protein